jgi:hypothetical protein
MKLFLRSYLGGVLALGLWLAPASSEAANVRLGLGGDYWFTSRATFQFTLGVDTHLAGPVNIGGRFGAQFLTEPGGVGVPLDLVLRALLARRIYLEGLFGPWITFGENEVIRAHVAFGFGVQTGALSFGLEVGYLSPEPILGLRLGYRF